jgi:hypothetical protein
VTEQGQSVGVDQVPAEAAEWAELAEGEWEAPGLAQVQEENACVQSAERRLPMKSEFLVTLRIALSAGQRW